MSLEKTKIEIIKKTLPSERVFFNFNNYPEYTQDATEEIFVPDILFFAESENDIVTAINLCRENQIPFIARGAGTGYSGGALAINGGLLLSIEKMNSIKIDTDKQTAIVGPGAITGNIMKAAESKNLFYPPDPASFEESTIAGNLAENAGGLRCKKYGVTKDYAISIRGINSRGNILEIGHASPFGLLDLIVGSEGTLIVFTQITLRLIKKPVPGDTILATFNNAVNAASVVSQITASGIVPCIMEFMDKGAIECSNQYDPANAIDPAAALLLFETDGPNAKSEAEEIIKICRKLSPVILRRAKDEAERQTLWATRRNLSHAVKHVYKTKISEDVCVPPSRLSELVAFTNELAAEFEIDINSYGHAGDGNLHVNFLGVTGSERENIEIQDGVARLFKKTLELGGTLSGEHGIGIAKKKFIKDEFDPNTLNFMKRTKTVLDPFKILNPGKIFE
ncbi:MAG: FAD-linked oxidase C-terminal domain-containing protein [candidate division Zixibacteria bacterium]